MKAAKKGTLKEKKDAMASLLNTVRDDKDRQSWRAQRKGQKKQFYRRQNQIKITLHKVVERTEGMNDAWEHFASADPAFANVASYRFSLVQFDSSMYNWVPR